MKWDNLHLERERERERERVIIFFNPIVNKSSSYFEIIQDLERETERLNLRLLNFILITVMNEDNIHFKNSIATKCNKE